MKTNEKALARIAGALYLVVIAIGLFGEMFVRGKLIASGDPTATAANVTSMETLWRLGIASEYVLLICALISGFIIFILLRPVNKDLALLAMFFELASVAVEAVITLDLVKALFPLGTAVYLKAYTPEQLNALTYFFIRSHGYGFSVSLIFFGCVCLIWGYLIFRSGYFPKTIGVLMQIAGICYLTNSFALMLAPHVAHQLFPAILVPSFIGETSLALWLLVKGVNFEKI